MLKETCPVPWRNPNSRRKAVLIPTRDFSSTNAQQHQQDLAELAVNPLVLGVRAAPQSRPCLPLGKVEPTCLVLLGRGRQSGLVCNTIILLARV